jgi:hypothetical protein
MPGLADLASDLGVKIDGVLGGELLRRLGAVADYDRRELRLTPDWATDLRGLQGVWVASDIEKPNGPPLPATRDNLHRVRLVVVGERMRLDMTAIGSYDLDQRLDLHTWTTPRRWVSSDVWLNGKRQPSDVGEIGLYELTGNRLRLLLPFGSPADILPLKLTAAVPGSHLRLITFDRLPPPLGGWPALVHAGIAGGTMVDQPVQLGGWQLAVTPDWNLTGTHPGRKLRFTAGLDGSVAVGPLRP